MFIQETIFIGFVRANICGVKILVDVAKLSSKNVAQFYVHEQLMRKAISMPSDI